MARMRKSARLFRAPEVRLEAERAMVPFDERICVADPVSIFHRHAPLEIELGAGKGAFIIQRATEHPERNFLAVELAASVVRILSLSVVRCGADNLKVMRADARTLVNLLLPDRCV